LYPSSRWPRRAALFGVADLERQQRYRANIKPRQRKAARAHARLAKLLDKLAVPELEAIREAAGMTWGQVLDVYAL
jgi:hypothetical protein